MKKVAVIMGSRNDYDFMKDAITTLEEFGIETEVKIVSAHRTPRFMIEFSSGAAGRGIEVIIAGAGGAAHLPGMTASVTHLPVIGVPIPTRNLNGMDSLLSIVQMPSGIPVATVAIGNSKNAALLAARILSIKYPEIAKKMQDYMESEQKRVLGESV
ncbi:MAG: 5-(carboxyamino)imidazole ribonucleotide mutase [Thermoplasmatales archaeon B_DKE]|nr:MAG: 5-(carboxyamino)imidazole ribonucleotide mutase [Thermoplasmatales archaeon B_DKE]QRF75168.1 N5-carboxyaminoimidazole ribonucleotide mutase [Thermoplasmatales archaeon]